MAVTHKRGAAYEKGHTTGRCFSQDRQRANCALPSYSKLYRTSITRAGGVQPCQSSFPNIKIEKEGSGSGGRRGENLDDGALLPPVP